MTPCRIREVANATSFKDNGSSDGLLSSSSTLIFIASLMELMTREAPMLTAAAGVNRRGSSSVGGTLSSSEPKRSSSEDSVNPAAVGTVAWLSGERTGGEGGRGGGERRGAAGFFLFFVTKMKSSSSLGVVVFVERSCFMMTPLSSMKVSVVVLFTRAALYEGHFRSSFSGLRSESGLREARRGG